jgi:hypothetical protein
MNLLKLKAVDGGVEFGDITYRRARGAGRAKLATGGSCWTCARLLTELRESLGLDTDQDATYLRSGY